MGNNRKPTVKVEAYGLTRAREDTGLTPAELAELTGKRIHYFYMLESLKRSPSADLQDAILEHLPGYEWDDVFRLVLVVPEDPPTSTLYIEQGKNGRQKISLGKEELAS
jgi:transcriptional regulator with XRE-family HTH domain